MSSFIIPFIDNCIENLLILSISFMTLIESFFLLLLFSSRMFSTYNCFTGINLPVRLAAFLLNHIPERLLEHKSDIDVLEVVSANKMRPLRILIDTQDGIDIE